MTELSPFRLDPANQCLWRRTGTGEEERVLLTRTEFAVLDHLVARAGQLVTHRELLDAVWPGTAIEPQVVKNKVFHLRRVLEDEPKRPRYIETLSRRGYRFVGSLERGTPEAKAATRAASSSVARASWLSSGRGCAPRRLEGAGRLPHRRARHRQDGAGRRVPAGGRRIQRHRAVCSGAMRRRLR